VLAFHEVVPIGFGLLPRDCVGSAEMGQTALLAKLVTENKDCEWIYRFRANPGWAVGRHRAAPAGLGPWVGARVASPRCPYPPPRLPQCNPEGYDRANSFSLDLARRLAFYAVNPFCRFAKEVLMRLRLMAQVMLCHK
jgi:hypothetical protein